MAQAETDETMADRAVVERAMWQFNEAVSLLREASPFVRSSGTRHELANSIENQLPEITEALRALAKLVTDGPETAVTDSAVLIPETAVDGCGTIEVGGHRANGPSRGRHLRGGIDMTNPTLRRRPTHRQLRLLQFMREMPADHPLAQWGEASWRHQTWNAARLVEASGIYQGVGARNACLRDLNALVSLGELAKLGNDRNTVFTIGEGFRA